MQTPPSSPQLNGYQESLELVRYEGSLLWQIFGAFLLAHTVFLGFALSLALTEDALAQWQLGSFLLGLMGLLLCLPWWSCFRRNSIYYIFRMAQAREKEPVGWDLVAGKGKRLAEGECVQVGGECHQIRGVSRWLRTRRAVPLLIIAFALAYAFVVAASGPWWIK